MDDADLRIVNAILREPLAPVASVARAARLGDSATRARIKRLRDEGTLGQVAAIPNGALLGMRYVVALYSGQDWRQMLQEPDVVGCSVNHEGVVAPTLLVREGLPDHLLETYGAPERTFVQHDAPLTPAGTELSDMQWRILAAFVARPTATDRDLARTTGVGARTVKRHREAFVRGGHGRLEVQMRSLSGDHALFYLYVQGPGSHDAGVAERLRTVLRGVWVQQQLAEPRGVLLFCAADRLATAAAAPRFAMEEVPGIEHAELVVSLDGAYDTDRLVAAVEAAARAAST